MDAKAITIIMLINTEDRFKKFIVNYPPPKGSRPSGSFARFLINRVIDFENICSEFEIRLDLRSNSGLCFCPFHDNHNTPAAKLYKDETGDTLYCFSENKLYRPYDLIDNAIINIDSDILYEAIWNKLNEEIKNKLTSIYENMIYNQEQNNNYDNYYGELLKPLNGYKKNKISYSEYKTRLLEIIKSH